MRAPLALWGGFVAAFTTLSYSARFTEGKPPKDLLYRWSTVPANLIQFAIIAAIVWGIAGLGNRRELLAVRKPTSWKTAAKIGVGIAILMIVLTQLLGPLLEPGQEQGVTPDTWQPDRVGAYIANGLVIAVVTPIVEEVTFRGLGYSLLARYGRWLAIVATGVAFGLAHGLVQALPFLVAFGIGLAYLRSRVDSVVPCIVLHGLFNAVALTFAVVGKPQPASILAACSGGLSACLPF